MDKQVHVTLFGAGNMGSAMLSGWLGNAGAHTIDVIDPRPGAHIVTLAGSGQIRLNPPPAPGGIVVIAIKPDMFDRCTPDIVSRISPQTDIVSIMAGTRLTTLENRLATPHVTRAMPNTPGLVGAGVTAFAIGKQARRETTGRVRALLEPLGSVEGPVDEDLLPVITALSGCGPAYVFLLVEMMAQAGVASGLDEARAMRLARRTVEGAGLLMQKSSEDAATMRQRVTSPNGVTASALAVLMAKHALPDLFRQAVKAAIKTDHALADAASHQDDT